MRIKPNKHNPFFWALPTKSNQLLCLVGITVALCLGAETWTPSIFERLRVVSPIVATLGGFIAIWQFRTERIRRETEYFCETLNDFLKIIEHSENLLIRMNESIRSGIKDGEDLKKHSFHKINSFNLVDLMHDQPFTVAIQHKTILTDRELNGEIDRALNQIELFSFKILKRGGEIGSGEMSRELNLIRKPFIDVVNLLALRLTYYTTRNQDMYPSIQTLYSKWKNLIDDTPENEWLKKLEKTSEESMKKLPEQKIKWIQSERASATKILKN